MYSYCITSRAYRAAEGGERAFKSRIALVDSEIHDIVVTKNTLPATHVLASIQWIYGHCEPYPDNRADVDKRSREQLSSAEAKNVDRHFSHAKSLWSHAKKYLQIQRRLSPCHATAHRLLLSKVGSASGVQQEEASQAAYRI